MMTLNREKKRIARQVRYIVQPERFTHLIVTKAEEFHAPSLDPICRMSRYNCARKLRISNFRR